VPATYRIFRGTFVGAAALLIDGSIAFGQTSATINGDTFVNQGLVGVGRISSDTRDKFGETFGSMSGMVFDSSSWRRNGDSYSGTLFALPDRGYNVLGTTNYRPRLNTLSLNFTPYYGTVALTTSAQQQNQAQLGLIDTTLLTEANGTPTTGLDPAPQPGVRSGRPTPSSPFATACRILPRTTRRSARRRRPRPTRSPVVRTIRVSRGWP
jgi:hypothetical protein